MSKKLHGGAAKEMFQRARNLRNNETHAEEILWGYLKIKPFGYKFRRQHPYGIYILDFYCHSLKLVIEIDGSIHNLPSVKSKDAGRERQLKNEGLTVMRFTNDQILFRLEDVLKETEKQIKLMASSNTAGFVAQPYPSGAGGMNRIYLDNAATTPLDPQVLEAMMPYLQNFFGNPSSIYSYGRETRLAIETARKAVAKTLGAHPGEIFFTSGGTESNNTAIAASIRDLHCRHIITSPIEHHAVLHTVEHYAKTGAVTMSLVQLQKDGSIDLEDLAKQLKAQHEAGVKTLVSLMHANNEIGTLLPLEAVGALCEKWSAVFHSDCVQTVGHYPIDLSRLGVHFISGAGHKFHGPKGIGILYVSDKVRIRPFIFGGGQERNMRAGTENVYGIVGFAKALELATAHYEKDSQYISSLKQYMAGQLVTHFKDVSFNGCADGLYTVLSVSFPKTEKAEFLLFNLDINNICVSGGSACSSGADVGSHVMAALQKGADDKVTVRFSFSKWNTQEEVDAVIEKLKGLL